MKNLKQVQHRLMIEFWLPIVISLSIICLFETETLIPGVWAADSTKEFIFLYIMELATIGVIPLALRLFKLKKIRNKFQDKSLDILKTLLHWGSVRLNMLTMPLMINIILYYLFMKVAFGYMAIILFLCLFFVFPTMERCVEETKVTAND